MANLPPAKAAPAPSPTAVAVNRTITVKPQIVGAAIPADLKAAGFIIPPEDMQDSLMISSAALEKQGKTHFACTAPGPIGYVSLDLGTKAVVDKFMRNRKVVWLKEHIPAAEAAKELKSDGDKLKYWKGVKESIYKLIDNKQVRTGIIDTATEAWMACRLGHLGKLSQVKAHHYDAPNDDFRSLIRDLQTSGKNWVLLHKKKKAYIDNEWDGRMYERAGFADMGFLAEVNIEHFRANAAEAKAWKCDINDFCIKIVDCRANGTIKDEILVGNDACTFAELALAIYPDSDPANWS